MTRNRNFIVAGLLFPFYFANGSSAIRAEDMLSSTSIRLAPADADFYAATYRMKEQWASIVSGPVVKKFLDLPVVQENLETFLDQWKNRDGNVANLRMVWENPNAKDAVKFATELVSEECFFLGDKNTGEFVRAYSRVINAVNELAVEQLEDETASDKLMNLCIDEIEKLMVPMILIGAKCKDEDLAITKVDQLEASLQLSMGFVPELAPVANSIKRIDDDRGSRLTVEFNGKMIPWELLPLNDQFDEEVMEILKNVLNEKSIALTIGTLDSYFVIGISTKRGDLLKLGKGANLTTHPDLAPVVTNASKPITSVSYLSDNLAKANYDSQFKNFFTKNFSVLLNQFMGVQTAVHGLNGDAGGIDSTSEIYKFFEGIKSELRWMDESIAKFVPEARGTTAYSFSTTNGWEQVYHARTKNVLLDGSKPLAALQHIGGDPMMMVVTRIQDHPEYFGLMRQIVQRFKTQLDRAFKIDWSDTGVEMEEFKKAQLEIETLWPMLVKLADAWETKVLPGLNGEHGVVMSSGGLAAKQWAKEMPPSDVPLPLPEVASVSGVRDAAKLQEAAVEFFAVCDSLLDYVRSKDPNSVPANYSIPRPVESKSADGVKFGYPIPDDCPAPKSMMPHGLFSGNYLFGGYSEKQSEMLAKSTRLTIGAGVIDTGKPLANASYLSIGRIMSAAKPWVVYGVKLGVNDLDAPLEDPSLEAFDGYAVTTNDLLSMWGVLETIGDFSSTTEIGPDGTSTTRSVYKSMPK
jgi:hypothetical protein